jgi:hypothetical protein
MTQHKCHRDEFGRGGEVIRLHRGDGTYRERGMLIRLLFAWLLCKSDPSEENKHPHACVNIKTEFSSF